MVAAVPELEINEIIDDIAPLMDRCDASEFQVMKIRRRISLLWQRDALLPYEYYMAMAMLEVVAGNRIHAEAAAKNALIFAPNIEAVVLNCLGVYARFLNVDAVVKLIHHMRSAFPDNKRILRSAIRNARDILQFSFVKDTLIGLRKLSENDSEDDLLSEPQLMRAIELAESIKMSDEDLACRLKVAIDSVRNVCDKIRQVSSLTSDDGEVILHLHVDASYHDCAELNFVIADALVGSFENTGSELVSIICLPFATVSEINPNGVSSA